MQCDTPTSYGILISSKHTLFALIDMIECDTRHTQGSVLVCICKKTTCMQCTCSAMATEAYPDIEGRCFLTFQCGRSCTSDGALGICIVHHTVNSKAQTDSCMNEHALYVAETKGFCKVGH